MDTNLQKSEARTSADLEAITRLYDVGNFCMRAGNDRQHCLDVIVEAALLITGADKATLQLLNTETGSLQIAAQRHFEAPFLTFFSAVRPEDSTACSAAMKSNHRVVIEDITKSSLFMGQASQSALFEAGVRAVQSTPILSSAGDLLGVISTHFEQPHRFSKKKLRLIDLLVRQAADYLERSLHEKEMETRENWLRGISEALEKAINGLPLPTSLAVLVRTVNEGLGKNARAAFYIVNGMTLHHLVGMPEDYAKAVDGFQISAEFTAESLATYKKKPVLTPDIMKDPTWKPWLWLAKQYDYRGFWSFPIYNEAGLFGTLAIYWRTPREATPLEMKLISHITSSAAIIFAQNKEIESHRHTEETLERTQNQLVEGQRIANLGSWQYIRATQEIIWSDEEKRIFGLDPSQPSPDYREMLHQFIHPDDVAQLNSEFRAALRNREPFETENRIVRPDNAIRWIYNKAQPYFDKKGNVLYYIGTTLDITERKEAELALRESEERFRAVFNYAAMGIAITDLEGRFLNCNPAYCRLLGYTEAEIKGTDFSKLVHPDDRAANKAEVSRLQEERLRYFEIENRYVRKDGQSIWVHKFVSTLRDMAGQPSHFVALVNDVTERRRLIEALRDADLRKNEFLAMLAHELRNPLTPISMIAQLLKQGMLDKNRYEWACEVLNRNLEMISRLVNDLLDVSRITRGLIQLKQAPLELNQILADSVEAVLGLIISKQQTLERNLPEQAILVYGDAVRLTQVFTNLLHNAAKYTQERGIIQLSIITAEESVHILVKDNGKGLVPELLPYVFELFAQGEQGLARSEGGLGIGLTLVKKLVEMHEGTITARSEGVNQGAEFQVTLPRFRSIST